MMKKVGIRFLICGISCILAFVMWTRLIQMVDVRAVGPNDTYVGFASINSWFHKMLSFDGFSVRFIGQYIIALI